MFSKGEHGEDIHTVMFEGLFSAATCPFSTSSFVYVHTPKLLTPIMYPAHRLSMDSSAFEKYFNVYTQDDILCMQILTSDVLDVLLTFREETQIPIDLMVRGKRIYIRYHTKDMFELPHNFKGPINKEEIEKIINTLSAIFKLNTDLNKCLQGKQIKYHEKNKKEY